MSGTTNRAFLGAYRKGYDAGFAGRPITDCPYKRDDAVDTYSASFARYWEKGWKFGAGERARQGKAATA